jgi:hypothetical protein
VFRPPVGTGRRRTPPTERVIDIRVLWVVIAIVVGLLVILLVGVAIHPDDGKRSNGSAPPTVGPTFEQPVL